MKITLIALWPSYLLNGRALNIDEAGTPDIWSFEEIFLVTPCLGPTWSKPCKSDLWDQMGVFSAWHMTHECKETIICC